MATRTYPVDSTQLARLEKFEPRCSDLKSEVKRPCLSTRALAPMQTWGYTDTCRLWQYSIVSTASVSGRTRVRG